MRNKWHKIIDFRKIDMLFLKNIEENNVVCLLLNRVEFWYIGLISYVENAIDVMEVGLLRLL